MWNWFEQLTPVSQALLATCFTWGVTALGAAIVFVTRTVNQRLLDSMNGFAAGVMLAASYWSLLAPAIELAGRSSGFPWLWPAAGFLSGCAFLSLADRLLPHLHPGLPRGEAEGPSTEWRRSILLVLAVTLHNIPEGLAVGVAFGAAAIGLEETTLSAAIALALGIGLQNFPEGIAVAMPLRAHGVSRLRSFWYGQLSGVVEPMAGVLGAVAVLVARPVLPFARKLIPSAQRRLL